MRHLFPLMLFVSLVTATPVFAGAIVRVAILPFNGAEAGEYATLTDTLTSMLISRIAARGDVELVDHPFASSDLNRLRDLDAARLSAGLPKMKADFLIKGGLYAVQSGLQLHLSVIPLDGKSEPRNYSAFAGAENQIIPAVEDLAQSASTRLRGEILPAEAPPALANTTAVGGGAAGFDTEHPDRIYQRLAAEAGPSIDMAEVGAVRADLRRGEPIWLAANAMAVGDVDGDGREEVAMATDGALRLFSVDEKMRLTALDTYFFPPDVRVNMVSLADLDGQPGLELYVSASQGTRPYGAIFRFSAQAGLKAEMKGIPWYIRPVYQPGQGVELLGQPGSDRLEIGYLGEGVHRLRLRPNFTALTDEGVVTLPPGVGVFDFAWLDLDGDGQLELAVIDGNSKLKIFNLRGELLWVSENEYGGGRNFIGPALIDDENLKGEGGKFRLLRYIPGRILVLDSDDDGKDEIIVSACKPAFLNAWLRNSREYDGGRLLHLRWDGAAMRESWRTARLSGYIADYGIPQPEQDAADSLRIIVAQRPGRTLLGFTLDDSTALLDYRIVPQPENTAAQDETSSIKN
ncbi:MAG: VCBS repeat-containing protein [Desulfobulbaceae bacterium]|jgi:hypothetical protein|nr:VCBS repeat-containing protein [Desulfobulbaceae bacterium]